MNIASKYVVFVLSFSLLLSPITTSMSAQQTNETDKKILDTSKESLPDDWSIGDWSIGLSFVDKSLGFFISSDLNFIPKKQNWIFGLNGQLGVHGWLGGTLLRPGGAKVTPRTNLLLTLGPGFGKHIGRFRIWTDLEFLTLLTNSQYVRKNLNTELNLWEFGLGLRQKMTIYLGKKQVWGLSLNVGLGILPWHVENASNSNIPKHSLYYYNGDITNGKIRLIYDLNIGLSLRVNYSLIDAIIDFLMA